MVSREIVNKCQEVLNTHCSTALMFFPTVDKSQISKMSLCDPQFLDIHIFTCVHLCVCTWVACNHRKHHQMSSIYYEYRNSYYILSNMKF